MASHDFIDPSVTWPPNVYWHLWQIENDKHCKEYDHVIVTQKWQVTKLDSDQQLI